MTVKHVHFVTACAGYFTVFL